MDYQTAAEEIQSNNVTARELGLSQYDPANLITPEVSGLANAQFLQAAHDQGIRYLVSDTSMADQDNPTPNTGRLSQLQPSILEIPRRPTGLDYNVSTPDEWRAEYNCLNRSVWGRDLSYTEILDTESDTLLPYLARGELDPWMFHQANLRDNGGGKSLLSDLLDATFAKYAARATFPMISPTMDELADHVAARMALDASGVSATIEPGKKLSVRVTNAATVPVTGLCTPSAETYAGQQISYLTLAAGQSVTLSLADCNPGATGTGGGGYTGSGADGGPTIGTLGNGDGGVVNGVVPDTGGCGCVVAGPERRSALPAVLLALAVAGVIRRRRRR